MSSTRSKAFISLFVVSVAWGCNSPLGAYLLQGFSPLLLSALRMGFSSLFLVGAAFFKKGIRRPTAAEWKYLLGAAVFGTLLAQSFFFSGLKQTTPGNASLIMALAPIATILLERTIFKVKLTAVKTIGAAVSLMGVFSIIGAGSGAIGISPGDLNIFVSMLCFSASLLFVRGLSRTMNSFMITVFTALIGSTLMFPSAAVEGALGGLEVSPSPLFWGLLIFAGIFMQGLGSYWWNSGVAEVGAGTAAMFTNIQPFVSILVAHFVLGNPIFLSQIIGGLFVLLGVYIANLPAPKIKLPMAAEEKESF